MRSTTPLQPDFYRPNETALYPCSACPRSPAAYDEPVTRAALIVLVLALSSIAACGTDPQGDDSTGPDAVAHQPVTMDVMPMCQDYTMLVRMPDGRQTRTTNRYAMIAGIAPDAGFGLEYCGLTSISVPTYPPCPAGATCIGTTGPTGAACSRSYRSGTFVDGKLQVSCGYKTEQFAVGGALESSNETRFASIRVTVY